MIDRREVLLGGSLSIVWSAAPCSCATAATEVPGQDSACSVFGQEAGFYLEKTVFAETFATGIERLEPRSGNRALDRALAQTLASLARKFEILPAFTYYDDAGAHNAKATNVELLNRTDGTVLFGLNFLTEMLRQPVPPGVGVAAVCAHEFGHILSYKNGMYWRLVPSASYKFRGEQFADFMTGYYAGWRREQSIDYPAASFAVVIRDLGRVARGTHGTRAERAEAVVEGYKAAFDRKLGVSDAAEIGYQFALARAI